MTKKKFKIEGMNCSACAMNIDFDLEDVSGIHSAKTSYAKGYCEVEFDELEVKTDMIIEVVKKTGYQAQIQSE